MQALICDSCEQPIVDRDNRVQVLIFTTEPIADPQLDLCPDCGADVVRSSKVQRGRTKAMDRIAEWRPPAAPDNPTGNPPDDYRPQVGDGPGPPEGPPRPESLHDVPSEPPARPRGAS